MKRMFAALLVMAAIILTGSFSAYGEVITPVSVSGTLLNKLIDGNLPAEGSVYTGSPCVSWTGKDPIFTVDLGRKYIIEDLLLSVDNNDDYAIEYSENYNDWIPLIKVDWRYGEIRWGMETLSTIAGDPEYVSGIDFTPVEARYLRIFATGGDDKYAVGEIMVHGYEANPGIHININPGSSPNTIDICARAGIPVIIWGSADFNVKTADVTQFILSVVPGIMDDMKSLTQCSTGDFGSYDPEAYDSIGAPDGYDDLHCDFTKHALSSVTITSNIADLSITGCDIPSAGCTEGSDGFYRVAASDSVIFQYLCNAMF